MCDATRWSPVELAKYLCAKRTDTDVWTGVSHVNYCDKFTGLKEEIIRATMRSSRTSVSYLRGSRKTNWILITDNFPVLRLRLPGYRRQSFLRRLGSAFDGTMHHERNKEIYAQMER
ncbi:hypothetical protein Trydic_g16085 [Trypoxylus dichotomus]